MSMLYRIWQYDAELDQDVCVGQVATRETAEMLTAEFPHRWITRVSL